jgi:hypothetical protein
METLEAWLRRHAFFRYYKMETKIFGLILTLDRSPETYKTWWIGSFGEDAGDLQLVDEGREDGVGGWVWTNEINNNVPVKSVKEIRKFW